MTTLYHENLDGSVERRFLNESHSGPRSSRRWRLSWDGAEYVKWCAYADAKYFGDNAATIADRYGPAVSTVRRWLRSWGLA